MALTSAEATTNKTEWTIQAPAVNLVPFTIWAWVYPVAMVGSGRGIFQQDNAGPGFRDLAVRSTGQVDVELDMDTTDVLGRPNTSNVITVNTWWFVAGSVTSAFVPHIYLGTLTTPVAEVTGYDFQTTGTTTPVSDSGGKGRWGNRGTAASNSFGGRIACGAYVSKALSVAELQALQYWPRRTVETVLYHQLGLLGTGTQPDLTGNGHTATITGATVADHVPLPLPFGRGRQRQAYRVAPVLNPHPWAHGGQDARFAPLIAQ